MRKFLTRVVWVVVAIGVIRGLVRYQQDHGSTGAERFIMAVVNGIADVVYRWVPPFFEFLSKIIAGG